MVNGVEAAVYGALGSACVEMLDYINMARRQPKTPKARKTSPFDEYGTANYIVSVVLRLVIGAIVAGALGASDQLPSVMMALGTGISAPLIIEQVSRYGIGLTPGADPPKPLPRPKRNGNRDD